jgi:hypothetical protein
MKNEKMKILMSGRCRRFFTRQAAVYSFFIFHFSFFIFSAAGQNVTPKDGDRIFVRGGVAEIAVENKGNVRLSLMTPDSLYRYMAGIDSIRNDGIHFDRTKTDSIVTAMIDRTSPTGDSLLEEEVADLVAERKLRPLNSSTVRHFMDDREFLNRYIGGGTDTLIRKLALIDTTGLSKREKRRLMRADTTLYRYNEIFRDSIKLSPMVALSIPVPGFSQFYNEQYWKIPVLYGTVAAGVGLWAWQTKAYKPYRKLYDYHVLRPIQSGQPGYDQYKNTMTELQGNMIHHNTYRQLAMGFAAASYIYFLMDGTLNYKGYVDDVKKATTLATVCPGAGQIYNQTYWKLPIVIGGAATLIYCIDWNNRGYQRYLRAYTAETDGDDATINELAQYNMGASELQNQKNSFRRNRDLCIILTGLFYVIQIIDAHATAHMKTYDVSDDLSNVSVQPYMDNLYSQRAGGNGSVFGMSLNITF